MQKSRSSILLLQHDCSVTRAARRARAAWGLPDGSPCSVPEDSVRDAADFLRGLGLSTRERERIVTRMRGLLTEAGTSPDAATRKRAAGLVDTMGRLAALLQRLSASA